MNTPRRPTTLDLPCRQHKDGSWRELDDRTAIEIGVRLHWPGRAPVLLHATPNDLLDLAMGHALLDLCEPGQVPELVSSEGETFRLRPVPGKPLPKEKPTIAPLQPKELLDFMAEFIKAPGLWDDTGCFHRAALLAPTERQFLVQVEDIGRHNCIDRHSQSFRAHHRGPGPRHGRRHDPHSLCPRQSLHRVRGFRRAGRCAGAGRLLS